MKVYLKRGAPNYKEKRLIASIEKSLEKKFATDPSLVTSFKPATTFDELKAMHNEYCIEDVSFTDVPTTKEGAVSSDTQEGAHEEFLESAKESMKTESTEQVSSEPFIDPFNSAEPIVRDYVKENGFKEEGTQREEKTTFDEPKDFKESFTMPSSEDEKAGPSISENKGGNTSKKDPKEKAAPLNPSFDDMGTAKKKRSTKKFAKLIVEGVCLLAERGCIWWTTKDITDDKLVEYELEGEMDLDILLTLDDNQKQPVREWFRIQVKNADTLFKISDEDKNDLIDSLFEVMMEKGIAPSPMQELIINAVKVFVLDMGLKAISLSSQIKGVLSQLRDMQRTNSTIDEIQDIDETGLEENPATHDSTALATT